MIRQPVTTRGGFEVKVVGDNGDEIAGVFAGFPAEREIMETMVKLRDKHRHSRPMRGGSDARLHTERRGEIMKRLRVGRGIATGRLPFDALEKNACLHVAMLVGMENVTAALKNPPSHARHDPRLIRTVKQGDERGRRHD